jgi:hypothetical protein
MTLVSYIGRLILDESLFDFFLCTKKVNELIIEFEDFPRAYKNNLNYKRKHTVVKIQQTGYIKYTILNLYVEFCKPTKRGENYIMQFGSSIIKNKFSDANVCSSEYNCEFKNTSGKLCFQIIMSKQKNMFYVSYEDTMLEKEDVVDICGQIIDYTDI